MSSVIPVVGLALLDSLSLGTLVIPLALIVHWRAVKVPALTAYLITVAAVYFLLGLGILLGFAGLGSVAERVTQTDVFPWITLILGAALAIFGIFAPNPKKPEPGQLPKRAAGATSSLPSMVALGLGASLTEAATMLPYIAAMGIIGSWEIPSAAKAGSVGIYCLIMIMPTVILATFALLFGQKVFPRLERLIPRLEYETKSDASLDRRHRRHLHGGEQRGDDPRRPPRLVMRTVFARRLHWRSPPRSRYGSYGFHPSPPRGEII